MENKISYHRNLNWLSSVVLVLTTVYILYLYGSLPDRIPTHFNGLGEPDGWGDKSSIFILLGITYFIHLLLRFLPVKPKKNSAAKNNDPEKVQTQIAISTDMKVELNTTITILLSYILCASLWVVLGYQKGLGVWFTPIFLILVLFPIIRALRRGLSLV